MCHAISFCNITNQMSLRRFSIYININILNTRNIIMCFNYNSNFSFCEITKSNIVIEV